MTKLWINNEELYLIKNYKTISVKQLSKKLNSALGNLMTNDELLEISGEKISPIKWRYRLCKPITQTWKTRDGREIPICKMTDSHLLNTIAYLKRYLITFEAMIVDDVFGSQWSNTLQLMIKEAKRRGIPL